MTKSVIRVREFMKNKQFHVYSSKGMISMLMPSRFTMDMWEIYPLDGVYFEDVERFGTKEKALKRCRELLE